MKFRVQGNAIRFRLNRREVEQFQSTGRVSASVQFPGGRVLTYSLVNGGEALSAAFDGAEVRISVPQTMAETWTATNEVGMNGTVSLAGGDALHIVIEKDFHCLHKGEAAKDPDAYPNPMAV